MERLQIRNFLNIKKADIDVGKINLIIGPQASGKSIIAKLLYFFREFLFTIYLREIENFETEKHVKKEGILEFKKYFPKYAWNEQEFNIIYRINDIEVLITHNESKHGESSIFLDYSKSLSGLYRKIKSAYKRKKIELKEDMLILVRQLFTDTIKNCIFNSEFDDSFNKSIFIPASRSFFANLQKNVFSFLANNIDIDPFIKGFGSNYEIAKQLYATLYSKDKNEIEKNKLKSLLEFVLVGKYKYEKEQDWIEYKDKKIINLADASSGQQEALPMLVILAVLPYIHVGLKRKYMFFIEEPEAHLFPVSQKSILSMIALIYNKKPHNFFLTTHSPYILTAINNAIMASEVAKKAGKEAVNKIMDLDYSIKYEDVRAYTIRDGIVESIMDEESRLIGASIIDSVSDEFDNVFDSLINLQMEQ